MNIPLKTVKLLKYYFIVVFFIQVAHAEAGKDLVNGKLVACPDKPNCVNTENHNLPPISYNTDKSNEAWIILQQAITELGGHIENSRADYLWATFESSVIKFTDDVEARLDKENKLIHLRSASRVGYYDFNANKKRLKKLINKVSMKLRNK